MNNHAKRVIHVNFPQVRYEDDYRLPPAKKSLSADNSLIRLPGLVPRLNSEIRNNTPTPVLSSVYRNKEPSNLVKLDLKKYNSVIKLFNKRDKKREIKIHSLKELPKHNKFSLEFKRNSVFLRRPIEQSKDYNKELFSKLKTLLMPIKIRPNIKPINRSNFRVYM